MFEYSFERRGIAQEESVGGVVPRRHFWQKDSVCREIASSDSLTWSGTAMLCPSYSLSPQFWR